MLLAYRPICQFISQSTKESIRASRKKKKYNKKPLPFIAAFLPGIESFEGHQTQIVRQPNFKVFSEISTNPFI
jgi:hypothetical protein